MLPTCQSTHLLLRVQGLMGTVGHAVRILLPVTVVSVPEETEDEFKRCTDKQRKMSIEYKQGSSHLWGRYLFGYMPASLPDGPMLFWPPGGAMPPSGPIT